MRIVFMGTPEFAVPSLKYLVLHRYQVVGVYTQPDKPVGRGRSPVPSPVKRAALDLNLPVAQPANLRDVKVVPQLAELRPEVVVVAAFGQLLPQSVLAVPAYGCVNIHPSLLPRFRGASPVAAAILAGERFTGVSLMQMDKGLDTGPILAQAQIPISAGDSTGSLTTRLSFLASRLLVDVLPRWVEGEITPRPQAGSGATYCGVVSKKEGEIDWSLSAVEVDRRVRAFQPWPGAYTRWQGKRLEIIESSLLPPDEAVAVGQVVARRRGSAVLGTGEGVLGILRLQLEGKRALSAVDFLRGQRQFLDAVLPSV